MTTQDYNNLRINYSYYQGLLASDIVRRIQIGSCDNDKLLKDLRIADIVLNTLSCYQIEKLEYSLTLTISRDASGNNIISDNIDLHQVIPGDTATSLSLPDGTLVESIDYTNHYIIFDHGIIGNPSNYEVTLSRINDINNCITTDEALSLIDVLNRIYNTNYCVDLILNKY